MKDQQNQYVSLTHVASLNAKNQLTKHPLTGATMTYDLAGNLKNDGTQVLTYDATGQQTEAKVGGVASLQQWYDGDRLRVKKVEAGETTYYVRSSLLGGEVMSELNNSGVMTKGYVYLGGQLLAIQQENAVTWVHQDPVTKSQRFTNSTGALESQRLDLDPWGVETNRTVDPTIPQQKPSHRFTSYERDGNGTDEAMHRRYNSVRARFEQPDPSDGSYDLSDPQSFNRYAYVGNDPVNFTDPSGLLEGLVCYVDGVLTSCPFGLGLVNSGAASFEGLSIYHLLLGDGQIFVAPQFGHKGESIEYLGQHAFFDTQSYAQERQDLRGDKNLKPPRVNVKREFLYALGGHSSKMRNTWSMLKLRRKTWLCFLVVIGQLCLPTLPKI